MTLTTPWRARLKAWAPHWPLALILAIALKLRLLNLFPTFFYGDDAEYGAVAQYLARDFLYLAYPEIEHFGPTPFVSQPPLVLYLMAIFIRLFGPSETSLVMVSVILGALTVAVVYAMGCVLQGRVTGVLSGLLLAVMPYHVAMSRKAFLDAGLVFFFALTLLFLTLYLKERQAKWAVWTGLAAGLAVLSKLPGILILPVLGIVLLVELGVALSRTDRWKAMRTTLRHAGLALIPLSACILAYVGLLFSLHATVDWWMKLMWQLGRVDPEFAQQHEVTQIIRPVDWYFTDPQYGLPAQMGEFLVLMAITGAVLVVALLLARPARGRLGLPLLLYAGIVLAFFTYSTRKEWFYMLPVAPAAAVLAALPVGMFASLFSLDDFKDRRWWKRGVAAGGLSVALVLAAIPAYAGVTESVDEYGKDYDKVFGYGTKEAALWIHENDPEAGQIGTLLGRFTLYYYNGQPSYHWYVPHEFIHEKIKSGAIKYVVLDNYLGLAHETGWMQGLVQQYNGQVVAEFGKEWGNVQVIRLNP